MTRFKHALQILFGFGLGHHKPIRYVSPLNFYRYAINALAIGIYHMHKNVVLTPIFAGV